MYQHEISIVTEGAEEAFPLIAITNLDFAKTLHIGKGDIVGFARPEVEEVVYIATTNELNVEPYVDTSPRNWIPPRKRVPLEPKEDSKKVSHFSDKRRSTKRFVEGIDYDEGKDKGTSENGRKIRLTSRRIAGVEVSNIYHSMKRSTAEKIHRNRGTECII